MDEQAATPAVKKKRKAVKHKTPTIKELKAEIARLQAQNEAASKSATVSTQDLLAATVKAADWKDRETKEERMARIMSDPAPRIREEVKKDYPTTEQHYILCVDEKKANKSMPIPKTDDYKDLETGEYITHKLGNFLVSDRALCPAGWIRMPQRGTPIQAIEKEYPAVFEILKQKEVRAF